MSKYETLKPYKGKTCITHPEILHTDELGKSDILERERERELTASVRADFTILGKRGGFTKRKGSQKTRRKKLFLMIPHLGMLFES